MKKRNPSTKGKRALHKAGRAVKRGAGALLGAGAEVLKAGAQALNPGVPRSSKDPILKNLLFDYWSTLDIRAATLDGMRSIRKRLAMLRAEGGGRDRIAQDVRAEKEAHAHIKGLDKKISGIVRQIKKRQGAIKRNPEGPMHPVLAKLNRRADKLKRPHYGEKGNQWRQLEFSELGPGLDWTHVRQSQIPGVEIYSSPPPGVVWFPSSRNYKRRNPRGEHLPGLPRKAQREYEHILSGAKAEGRYKGREKQVAARTVRKQYGANPKTMPALKYKVGRITVSIWQTPEGKYTATWTIPMKGSYYGHMLGVGPLGPHQYNRRKFDTIEEAKSAADVYVKNPKRNPHGMSEKAWQAEERKWRKSIAAYRAKGWSYQQIKDRLWLAYGLTLDKLTDESATFVDPFRASHPGFTLDLIGPLERRKMAKKSNPDYPYWNVYHIDTKKPAPYDKTFLGSSHFNATRAQAIEQFRRSHYPGRLRAGTKIIAEKAVVTMKNPKRRRNLGHKDSDHPVEVTHHYRAGPPGYMTPWQRAHHAGQKQLFETGIKPAKRRNASGSAADSAKWEKLWSAYINALKAQDIAAASLPRGRGKYKAARMRVAKAEKAIRLFDREAYEKYVVGRRNPRKGARRWAGKSSKTAIHRKEMQAEAIIDKYNFGLSDDYEAYKKARDYMKGKRRSPNPRAAHGRQVIGAARKLARKGHTQAQIAAKLKRSYSGLSDRELKALAGNVIAESKRNPTRKGMRKGYGQARALGRSDPKRKPVLRKAARGGKQIMRKVGRNPSAAEIRKDFAGRVGPGRDLYFPQGTPPGQLAKLGKLVLIKTDAGDVAPVGAGQAWLCADTRGKLHIGTTKPAPLFDGSARSLGAVRKIEYEESKPHLGYPNPIVWYHHAGEETGRRPKLYADGRGGLVFKGGAYRLTTRGIEN